MKIILLLILTPSFIFLGCAKDKNMDDFRRDQLQQSLSRISAVSGSYFGNVISRIDGSNLGSIILKFQAKTDVQISTGQISSQQNVTVSGSLRFRSISTSEVSFENGFYDDQTGDFQVVVPINQPGGIVANLALIGVVHGDSWAGSLEIKGQSEFGADLNLSKYGSASNTSAIEVGGIRLQQINKMNFRYEGSYKIGDTITPFKMSFINLPDLSLFSLFSPIHPVTVVCDFTGFELNFTNAIVDDKTGTISGHDPFDQRGVPARANLNCLKFDEGKNNFGWDCEIQTKVKLLRLHLNAIQ